MSLYQTHIHSLGNDPLVMQVATTANGVLDARIKGAQGFRSGCRTTLPFRLTCPSLTARTA